MSEAVTNAEIEDVLSSIRQLVSENAVPKAQAVAPAQAARNEPDIEPEKGPEDDGETPVVEKLVLTPAFRVHEAAAPVDAPVPTPEPAAEASPDLIVLSDPISEPVAEEVPEDQEEPEAAEAELAELAWPYPEEAAEPATAEARDTAAADSLESRIAELEAVIRNTPGDWEPDGSEVEPEEPQTVVFEHAAWSAREDNVEDEAEEEAGFVDVEDAPIEEAEVISIASKPEQSVEPAPEDEAEPDAAQFEADPADDDYAALFEDGFDEAVIDEEVLREMVQRLVREELQGTVGERITRNVRRLVRREIQRALTLRDFE